MTGKEIEIKTQNGKTGEPKEKISVRKNENEKSSHDLALVSHDGKIVFRRKKGKQDP